MAYPSPLTQDIPIHRFGTPGNSTQPISRGIKAGATVYRGSIAVARSGYLVAGSSPQTTDVCWGIIDKAGAGQADTGPGITGGTTDGGYAAEVSTGSFWVNQGTGVDALTVANGGQAVYMINETTVGATSQGTRPIAGVLESAGSSLNVLAGMVAVKFGPGFGAFPTAGGTGGPS